MRLAVPVPVLPPEPVTSNLAGPVTWVLGGLGAVLAFVFAGYVIRVVYGRARSDNPFRVALAIGVPALVLVLAAAGTDIHRRGTEARARTEFGTLAVAAGDEAQAQLERAYGITFASASPLVPVLPDEAPTRQRVVLPDGTTAECFLDIEDQHYVVLCGGDTPETSVPLVPGD